MTSLIRHYKPYSEKWESQATSLFDCFAFKTFWISWNDTTIEVGIGGVVGTDMLNTYTQSTALPSFDEIGVGAHKGGDWNFRNEQVCIQLIHARIMTVVTMHSHNI